MTFFLSHRSSFSNFPSLLSDFPDLCFVRYRTQPFPHKKKTFFPFWRQKFLITFFSSSTRFFEFSLIFRVFTLLNVVHDPFLTTKPLFLLFSYFRAHPTTLLLKILGGRMHGHAPTSNFRTTVPSVPPRFRPGHFYSASSSPLLLRGAPDYSTDTNVGISEFHAEAHRQMYM